METFDIILDSDSQIQVNVDGDFKTGDNANNLIYYNIVSHQGHYRAAPLIGVGIESYLNGNELPVVIERKIKSSLKADIFPKAEVNASNFPEIVINKTIVINENS